MPTAVLVSPTHSAGPNRFAQAIEASGADVVPKIVMGGGGPGGPSSGNMMESLLAMLLSERMLQLTATPTPPGPEVAAIKGQILQNARAQRNGNGVAKDHA